MRSTVILNDPRPLEATNLETELKKWLPENYYGLVTNCRGQFLIFLQGPSQIPEFFRCFFRGIYRFRGISRFAGFSGFSGVAGHRVGHPRKGLINIQNIDDNKCFKLSIFRYLNTANHHRAKTIKADKDFTKKFGFKDIIFPVKIRDIHKIEKKNSSALAFLVMKIRKNIQSMCQKNVAKKNMLTYY